VRRCHGLCVSTRCGHEQRTAHRLFGIGGLGHLAVQFASKLGNRVVAFTTSEDKAALARELGAHETVLLPRDGSFAAPPAPEKRLDILLVTATADLDWVGALSVASVPESDLQIPVMALQNKRRRVTGSNVGSRAVIEGTLRIAAEYDVRPIIETFPMHDANVALERVRANQVRFRAVLMNE